MMKIFLTTWCYYWIVFFVQPVESMYENIEAAFLLQLYFVLLVFFSYSVIPNHKNHVLDKELSGSIFYIKAGIIYSLIGLCFLMYDKLFIQGIDYSQGFSAAREEWRRIGEERSGGASSIFSVIGYCLNNAYFISAILLVKKSVRINEKRRLIYLLIVLILALANAVITGGRSNILLLVSFLIPAYLILENKKMKIFKTKTSINVIKISFFLLILYTVIVFQWRSQASESTLSTYSVNFLDYLGLIEYRFLSELPESISSIVNVLNLTISYLTHSISTTAAILNTEQNYDTIIVFNHIYNIAGKIGFNINHNATDWFLAGRFPSLPGALYYQYGLTGVTISSLTLGILSKIFFLRKKNRGYFSHLIIYFFASILILSPLLFAGDFLSYPFIIISMIILYVTHQLKSLLTSDQSKSRHEYNEAI